MIKTVKDVREAVLEAMKADDNLTKYKLAKELNLSTAAHINNFITGKTKKTRTEVMKLFLSKYSILIQAYKDSAEYKKNIRKHTGIINV